MEQATPAALQSDEDQWKISQENNEPLPSSHTSITIKPIINKDNITGSNNDK